MVKKATRAGQGAEEPNPKNSFDPETLDRTTIALPLIEAMRKRPNGLFEVIIDVNLEYHGQRKGARDDVRQAIMELVGSRPVSAAARAKKSFETLHEEKSRFSQQYVFARLRARNIRKLAKRNAAETGPGSRSIYKIWEDHKVKRFTNKSASTIKADAARNAFAAVGADIVWAVVDTGVDKDHPQFKKHKNLELEAPLRHRDFTDEEVGPDDSGRRLAAQAERDGNGHGTHVAGIIAGELPRGDGRIVAAIRRRDETGEVRPDTDETIDEISGMAPRCKILSLKVLDDNGAGLTSNIIAALEYVQTLNSNGRRLLVHGVNLSVGYDFEPKWFACGQSPLCVEVNRLVRSGVVVVVAAGNTGYGYNQSDAPGPVGAGLDVTINDPGNAELAITVGATHRDMPHVYGVSYFSSKGPTGDGRLKPDLLAPGERIISCHSRQAPNGPELKDGDVPYREDSGTSMAAPHVSGAVAAFLSIRREFIGRPERVKEIFLNSATDLGRAVYFQGRGLVDLMRAIQSV